MKKKFAHLILILIFIFLAGKAYPDFGSFSGNSDYSSSSRSSSRSSSGSSRSSRSSSSSYSGWSGSSSSSRSPRSSNSGYNTFNTIPMAAGILGNSNNNYYDDNEDDEEDDFSSCIGLLIFIAILFFFVKGRRKAKHERQLLLDENRFNNNQPVINLIPIEEYLNIDPEFDENELTAHLANLYVQMQDAWTAKNIEILRPYLNDAFYNQMDRQLDAFRKQNKTDYTEKIAVLDVYLKGFRQSGSMDYIVAGLRSRIVTYVLDDLTGELISGDKNREKFMEYEIELSRKSGTLTNRTDERIKSGSCPNCGAPININASAKCPYCGSIIKTQNINWAVCAMRGISQKTA